VNTGTLEK